MSVKKIRSALVSVYYKDGLAEIVQLLHQQGVTLYSTGGTQQFIAGLGIPVIGVEDLTGYPSILGGRVKTLHPKIFGGILSRRDEESDILQATEYEIPPIDLVIVDLYPFEETVANGGTEQAIIEKIDIGGISLIRAAAKNFKDVAIIASREHYHILSDILKANGNETSISERKYLATLAFDITSHYDTAIFNYFNSDKKINSFKQSYRSLRPLRYGENPHQQAVFLGNLDEMLNQLHGKELSYNNLVDIDAAIDLIAEFEATTPVFAILKHTNPCGVAVANTPQAAYLRAFQADTVSAFGGVIISNTEIDTPTAEQLNQLFFEVLIAPAYQTAALEILKSKKNRILLIQKQSRRTAQQFKSLLSGAIAQDKDIRIETESDFTYCTTRRPTEQEVADLLFANKIVKHTKSNAIVLAKDGQMLSSGVGQTSRVDALQQAIEKAKKFGFELTGSVMASDAFFPFPDCVEIANKAGITAVIQPGGSVKDQDSVDYCNAHNMAMVMTGIRHFKH
jgi:phosphoribosylaminoimidazolecarboxamide formyltransferase/IMP cyclohydrolase